MPKSPRDVSNNSRNARLTPSNARNISPNQRIKTVVTQNQVVGSYRPQQSMMRG